MQTVTECGRGVGVGERVGEYEWRCGACGWHYLSLFDDGVIPRHWIDGDGRVLHALAVE